MDYTSGVGRTETALLQDVLANREVDEIDIEHRRQEVLDPLDLRQHGQLSPGDSPLDADTR